MDLRDPEAFRAVYENNAKKLFNLALRLLGTATGEEIVQETFLRAFDRAETFGGCARAAPALRICANSPTTTSGPPLPGTPVPWRPRFDESGADELRTASRPRGDAAEEASKEECAGRAELMTSSRTGSARCSSSGTTRDDLRAHRRALDLTSPHGAELPRRARRSCSSAAPEGITGEEGSEP